MSSIRGFFHSSPDTLPVKTRGFVRGRIELPWHGRNMDVLLKIDTGSDYTLLVDVDFVAVVQAIGNPHRPGSGLWLQWVDEHDDLFQHAGRARTLGGRTGRIYRLRKAWLVLCDRDGAEPHWVPRSVCGTLGPRFTDPAAPPSYSLLGLPTINALDRLHWSHGRSVIDIRL